MDNCELKLLSRKDLWGKSVLNVLKKYGLGINVTDLSVYTGCLYRINNGNFTGRYYTESIDSHAYGYVSVVENDNPGLWDRTYMDYYAIRPILINSSKNQKILFDKKEEKNGVCEVTLGEYPTSVAGNKISNKLEKMFNANKLIKTGKKYTLKLNKVGSKYEPVSYDEYEYEGKKYIRIENNSIFLDEGKDKIKTDKYVFIEVKPVKWLLDEKTKILIAKDGLISGILFDDKEKYDNNFENTIMYKFLNEYMIKDIFRKQEFVKEQLPESNSLAIVMDNKYHSMIDELIVKILRLVNNSDKQYIKKIVKDRVRCLIDKFNNDMDSYKNSSSRINGSYKELAYQELGYRLNNILHKLEIDNEGMNEYLEMNNLLKRYIELLKNDELYQELGINSNIFKLDELGKKELYNRVLFLLNDYQKKIENFINEVGSFNDSQIIDLLWSSVSNLKLNILDDINYLIYDVNNRTVKRDFNVQFNKGLEQIGQGKYKKNDQVIADVYLDYINSIYNNILNNDPDKLPEFMKLLNFNIANNDFDTLNESLKEMIKFNNKVLIRKNDK